MKSQREIKGRYPHRQIRWVALLCRARCACVPEIFAVPVASRGAAIVALFNPELLVVSLDSRTGWNFGEFNSGPESGRGSVVEAGMRLPRLGVDRDE